MLGRGGAAGGLRCDPTRLKAAKLGSQALSSLSPKASSVQFRCDATLHQAGSMTWAPQGSLLLITLLSTSHSRLAGGPLSLPPEGSSQGPPDLSHSWEPPTHSRSLRTALSQGVPPSFQVVVGVFCGRGLDRGKAAKADLSPLHTVQCVRAHTSTLFKLT